MIHGPCGIAKKAAVCMRGGSCSKQFPKKFTDTTSSTKDGYSLYRRRDDSRTVEVGGIKLDNRWVVPYNPYLLLKYNAHINVEICSTVIAVKYLYKYVYKGHDRAIIGFQTGEHSGTDHTKHVDEVSNYLEACYRIFAHELSYLDFIESFVWDKTKREWKQRLKEHGTTIGRLYSAHPGEGEILFEDTLKPYHWLYRLSGYSHSSRRYSLSHI